jgi:hypothetical protein
VDITTRKSKRWLLASQERRVNEARARPRAVVLRHFNDGALLQIRRGEKAERSIRMGPNAVHAMIAHPDGDFTDLGVSFNLLTNIGRDVLSSWMGGFIPAAQGSPATATSSTSVTSTGTPWTASNLATPQLGLATFRVYMPVTGITTAPVYGNIIKNTTSVATIDQWWTAADGVGTTPASTNALIIAPGGIAAVRFMGLTTDSAAASASDTVLATEQTTNGVARALATYAHTQGAATFTLAKTWTASGTITALHKMGLFCCLSPSAALNDPVVFETVLSADATLVNLDQLTVTDTVTVSG